MRAGTILRNDPRFSIFLDILGDKSTGDKSTGGTIQIPGAPQRDQLQRGPLHRAMTQQAWLDWEMIVPDPKHSLGRKVVARITGSTDHLPILPKRVVVLDFDESKRDVPRDIEQILDLMDIPWICAAPTRTPGNWQVYIGFATPVWPEQLAPFAAAVTASMGADPAYRRGTMAWNPIARTFHPQTGTGATTIWNPCLLEGEYPVVHLDQSMVASPTAPCSATDTSVPQPQRAVSDLDGRRFTVEELRELMRQVVVGEGKRHELLYRYMYARICTVSRELDRPLTPEEVVLIGRESDKCFPVPVTRDDIDGLVPWFTRPDADGRPRDLLREQVMKGRKSGRIRAARAQERYWEYEDTLLELVARYAPNRLAGDRVACYIDRHGTEPHEAVVLMTHYGSWDKVPDYGGRKASTSHVAVVLGVDVENVRNTLKRGRKRTAHAAQSDRPLTLVPDPVPAPPTIRPQECRDDLVDAMETEPHRTGTQEDPRQYSGTGHQEDGTVPLEYNLEDGSWDAEEPSLILDEDKWPAVGGGLPDPWSVRVRDEVDGPHPTWSAEGGTFYHASWGRDATRVRLEDELSFEDDLADLQHLLHQLEAEVA